MQSVAQDPIINDALKTHAISVEDWQFRALSELLHAWAAKFNIEFKLDVETPVIQIDRTRRRILGWYRRGRNGLGLRHEIMVNSQHLSRPPALVLETLLHELLHQWQDLHGKSGKGNFHNLQFRQKAASLGLIVSHKGHSLGVKPGFFTELLARGGVDISVFPPVALQNQGHLRGNSKMRKWSCRCTNVRAAVILEARCLKCGELFQRTEAAW
jgi:hypothetical protein